jgi:hypothetical protein
MKTFGNKTAATGYRGYTDAPPEIEKAMKSAVRVRDFLPVPGKLVPRTATKKERKQTAKAWERYRIKDHERGHRTPLSKVLDEPTARLDTSIMLPKSVYNWVRAKPNRAAFVRETLMKSYGKQRAESK